MTQRRLVSWHLVLVLAAAGCSVPSGSLAPGTVLLLTGDRGAVGCPANVVEGDLVVDEKAGSAIIDDAGVHMSIRWPFGFVGRSRGAEVEIIDQDGIVVARTGTRIRLGGGETAPGVWLACPDPRILP